MAAVKNSHVNQNTMESEPIYVRDAGMQRQIAALIIEKSETIQSVLKHWVNLRNRSNIFLQ